MNSVEYMKYMNLVLSAVMIIPAAYYFYLIRRIFKTAGADVKNKIVIIIEVVLTLIIWHFLAHLTSTAALFLYCILGIEIFVHLIDLLVSLIFKKHSDTKAFKIWKKVFGLLIIPVVATIAMFVIGNANIKKVVETHYTVTTDKDIKSDFRICFLSDVHCGNVLKAEDYQTICDEISSKDIDILVIGGDLADFESDQETTEGAIKAFGTIKAKYGKYYVFGNHDRVGDYKESFLTEEYLYDQLESNDITILKDEIVEFPEGITLVGREDQDTKYGRIRVPADELFEDVNLEDFVVVADHEPSDYKLLAKLGADLILNGHLHAGQIFPSQVIVKMIDQEHVVNDRYLITQDGNKKVSPDGPAKQGPDTATAIVSTGFIGWSYPIRTGSVSEYCIIDIKPE